MQSSVSLCLSVSLWMEGREAIMTHLDTRACTHFENCCRLNKFKSYYTVNTWGWTQYIYIQCIQWTWNSWRTVISIFIIALDQAGVCYESRSVMDHRWSLPLRSILKLIVLQKGSKHSQYAASSAPNSRQTKFCDYLVSTVKHLAAEELNISLRIW